MRDLNTRIKQLTKLILTSQTVDEAGSRPGSPVKVDFDMSPYQVWALYPHSLWSSIDAGWKVATGVVIGSPGNRDSSCSNPRAGAVFII
jgi:hypothetical protein